MSENNELTPYIQKESTQKGIIPALKERLHGKETNFNWQRWIDPNKLDYDTYEHTRFVQHQAFECMRIFKKKGYGSFNDLTGALAHESDRLLINDSSSLGRFIKDEGIWKDKNGNLVGIGYQELSKLEAAILKIDPHVRELTQDRIVARYFLLRQALNEHFIEGETEYGLDLEFYRQKPPYLSEVRLSESNPNIIDLLVSASIAREAMGDAMKLYDSDYKENSLDSPRYIFGHAIAVRRELAEKIPPLLKIKKPRELIESPIRALGESI